MTRDLIGAHLTRRTVPNPVRPALHEDCARRIADAESQGRTNFDAARRTVERRTAQRDAAREDARQASLRVELLQRQVTDLEAERDQADRDRDDMIRVIAILVGRLGGSTVLTFEELTASPVPIVAVVEGLDGVTVRTAAADS